jgi:hypothetical protein
MSNNYYISEVKQIIAMPAKIKRRSGRKIAGIKASFAIFDSQKCTGLGYEP